MRILHAITLALFLACGSFAAVIYVPDAHPTIQAAIDAAANGDTIIVRPGRYVENIDFLGKAIIVRSQEGPDVTIIDGGEPKDPDYGSVVTFESGEGRDSVLDGFTLRNGTGDTAWGSRSGGGVFCRDSSPIIKNNVIARNTAEAGGGVSASGQSVPVLLHNRIVDNVATENCGGGIRFDGRGGLIQGNTIARNEAIMRDGGGIVLWYTCAKVIGNVIRDNATPGLGGGVFCVGSEVSEYEITGNFISGNTANNGGGIRCQMCESPRIDGNVIACNCAFHSGGGIYSDTAAEIVNNLIVDNWSGSTGGGMTICQDRVTNCTLAGNVAELAGGGACCQSGNAVIVNSIIWGNSAPQGAAVSLQEWFASPSYLNIDFSNVQGGAAAIAVQPGCELLAGEGVFAADPLFLGVDKGYCFLRHAPDYPGVQNPSVDAGDPSSPAIDGTVLTSGERDTGRVDLGYHYPLDSVHLVPDEHPSIQAAIDAARAGHLVSVGPGTYLESVDFGGKAIWVRSRRGADLTTIDGSNARTVVTFQNGESEQSVLEGFTITNGKAHDYRLGGGVHCEHASPTILENIIIRNESSEGAGIRCWCASPAIVGNTIIKNDASSGGGGINCDLSSPVIRLNTIAWNTALFGGGIYSYASSPVIEDNTISGHDCALPGGGMDLSLGSATIRGNAITGNSSPEGGGIRLFELSAVILSDNVICGNETMKLGSGAGIYCFKCSGSISNNILCGNVSDACGGGICCTRCDLTVTNNTIAMNTARYGGGIGAYGTAIEVANSIFWGNSASGGKEISLGGADGVGSHLVIGFSNVDGWNASVYVGTASTMECRPGNIDADPLFVDAPAGDFHIPFDSPCRDAGVHALPWLPEEDFESDPRVGGEAPDMGADEFSLRLYHAGAVTPGGTIDLRVAGAPGTPVGLAHSLSFQDPPQPTPYGKLYLTLPPHSSAKMGVIPANGILSYPLPVPAFWSAGDEKYFQALAGALGAPGTRLTNLATLLVE